MAKFQDDYWNMGLALEEAEMAYKLGEVPVGAVIVDQSGKILSKAYNEKEMTFDPCAHAEILAIKRAAHALKNWRLSQTILYVTLEPCSMCLAAMVQARIKKLIFGAYDPKGGAISLGHHFYKDVRLNHNFDVCGGLRHFESSRLMSNFFKERRHTI